MFLVDTNIFLEVLLAQARKEECEKFLSSLKTGKRKGVITDFTLNSIIVILGNLNRLKELKIFFPASQRTKDYTFTTPA